MNARVPIYEGDALAREALAKAAQPAPAPARLDPIGADLAEIERRARELRAEVIADLFARLFRAIERALWRAQQRDVEHYLSQATDAADLERRMRELERSPRSAALGSLR
jgi:hypothetical protein